MSLADQQWCPTSVQVTVLQARGLRIKGKSGTNDAYAVMQVGKEKYQTSVVEKSVAPVWKEEATFDLPQLLQGGGGGGTERSTLRVHVLHRALVGPDKLLGQAVINLRQLMEDKTRNKTEWFKLLDKTCKADKDRGEVLVDIQFMRNNMTASMFDLSAAGKSRSRLGKFKDKVRGKKKESDAASTVVPSFTQVLTDSEEEGNGDTEVAAGKGEKKKKHKMKPLFSPKSNLQRNMSQSMSVLPAKNTSLSGSQSSGLNVDSSEGKKKFKFLIHKRSGSSDSKDSSSSHQKHGSTEQSNLCINGSHIYCEEPQTRTSRIGSNFSLASSGHGSMEDVPESSPPSVDSLRAVRQYSPWTEEEEEEMADIEHLKKDVGELKNEDEERIRVKEERRRKEQEEEMLRRQEEEVERLAEEKKKERMRIEEEEKRQREEEESKKMEEESVQEERSRHEEECKLAEEKRRFEEEERRRIEEEKVRKEDEERVRKEEKKRAQEERRRQEEEEGARREEECKLAEEKRRLEEERVRKEEEERIRGEEEERRRQEKEMRARREEEEREKLAEEKREEQERRRIEEEEKRQREEEERIRMKEERAEEERRRQEEEERARRQVEERKLAEEKRRVEEEDIRRTEEERVRKEEDERVRRVRREQEREQEERKRQQEELEEKRKLEEQERRRKKEEEEKARKQKEEYERLVEEKRKLEEEERKRIEVEEKIRKEDEERLRAEEERRRKEEEEESVRRQEEEREKLEEKRIQEEQERRQIEEEEKRQKEENERIRKEEERRQEEEERARKEKEEYDRLVKEKMKQEEQERRRIEEEERIRQEEQERIRMEKERRQEEEEQRIFKETEKNNREKEEKAEEEARKLETRNTEEQMKRENKTKHKAAGREPKEESPAEVTSTNPFDEDFSDNPFEDSPTSPAGPESSTAKVSTVKQRCQTAVSSQGSKTASTHEKDAISTQREKRPAPQPPGRNEAQRQSQREQDGSTRHLAQINKQSKGKDIKTVSVLPQRSVQMIAPLSRSPTDAKNTQSFTQSSTTKDTTIVAKHNKRPAPPRPQSVEEGPSSEPKTATSSDDKISNKCGLEAKQEPIVYGLNPFEDDEDENELKAQDDTTTNTGSVQWPPAVTQVADKDSTSQAKIKSSKTAHAPPLPAKRVATSSTVISQNTEGGHVTDSKGVTVPDNSVTHSSDQEHVREAPVQGSQPVVVQSAGEEAGGKKSGPPPTSRRLQPVKPLNPLGQQSVSVVHGEMDNKSSEVQEKTKVNDTGVKGPYSQLTREELISLVLKQEKQLSERDVKISELEQYIDNLLVRVIEEKPSILMSMNSLKKPV